MRLIQLVMQQTGDPRRARTLIVKGKVKVNGLPQLEPQATVDNTKDAIDINGIKYRPQEPRYAA